jgi:Tol biopolymer transport system component
MNSSEPRLVRLTDDGRPKADPVFVQRGEELVYTVQETPTLLSLMRVRLAGGVPVRLHPEAKTSEFEAGFSPDSRYYTFVQNRGNLNLKLVIRDTRLNRETVFDPGGGFAGMRRPTVAPDGSRIVFSIPTATGQELASVNLDGKDRRTLFQGGINNWPAFSPDGKHVVFGSSRDGSFQLYVINADGTSLRRLTSGPGFAVRPAWSADGKRIAFMGNRGGSYEVYLIHADGTGLCRLRANPERDDYPAWHPDGRRLALVAEQDGRHDLYLIETAI